MNGHIIAEERRNKERTVVLELDDQVYFIDSDCSMDIDEFVYKYIIVARLDVSKLTIKVNPYLET